MLVSAALLLIFPQCGTLTICDVCIINFASHLLCWVANSMCKWQNVLRLINICCFLCIVIYFEGLGVWAASILLSRWIASQQVVNLNGAVVVELGAGCGLPGLAAGTYCIQ